MANIFPHKSVIAAEAAIDQFSKKQICIDAACFLVLIHQLRNLDSLEFFHGPLKFKLTGLAGFAAAESKHYRPQFADPKVFW